MADYVVTRQPQVQSEAIGGWGGSAAGAADFLSRLARAETRDASSLKTLTGPKVQQQSPRWTSVRLAGEVPDAAEITARAIEELTSSLRRRGCHRPRGGPPPLPQRSRVPRQPPPPISMPNQFLLIPVPRAGRGVGRPRLRSGGPPSPPAGSVQSRLRGGVALPLPLSLRPTRSRRLGRPSGSHRPWSSRGGVRTRWR